MPLNTPTKDEMLISTYFWVIGKFSYIRIKLSTCFLWSIYTTEGDKILFVYRKATVKDVLVSATHNISSKMRLSGIQTLILRLVAFF